MLLKAKNNIVSKEKREYIMERRVGNKKSFIGICDSGLKDICLMKLDITESTDPKSCYKEAKANQSRESLLLFTFLGIFHK